MCEQHAHGCYADLSRWKLNPLPNERKSNTFPLHHSKCTYLKHVLAVDVSKTLKSRLKVIKCLQRQYSCSILLLSSVTYSSLSVVLMSTHTAELNRTDCNRTKWPSSSSYNNQWHWSRSRWQNYVMSQAAIAVIHWLLYTTALGCLVLVCSVHIGDVCWPLHIHHDSQIVWYRQNIHSKQSFVSS